MDELDRAAERTEAFTEVALHSVLARMTGMPSSGVCRSCGDLIEPERLKIAPHTRHCSDCAAEDERKARRFKRCGVA